MINYNHLWSEAALEVEQEKAKNFGEKWAENPRLAEVLLLLQKFTFEEVCALNYLIQTEIAECTAVKSASIYDLPEMNMSLPTGAMPTWEREAQARWSKIQSLKAK